MLGSPLSGTSRIRPRQAGAWLDEAAYGLRLDPLPLQGRTIAFTQHFKRSRHRPTVEVVAGEGGAIRCGEVEAGKSYDIIMCTSADADAYANGMTWEGLVKQLYPQPIAQ